MRVGILHQDLEDHEIFLCEELKSHGLETFLYDIRETSVDELSENDVILNRVFASCANRNFNDNLLALKVLEELESQGVKCINSHYTTSCDYSKYLAAKKMKEKGVLTPETFFVKDLHEISDAISFAQECSFPVVLKRDIGGRGKDIHLIKTPDELRRKLEYVFVEGNEDGYNAGYIVQEFVKSVLDYDIRISMVNGEIIYSMTRSFVSDESGESWIASMSLGSKEGQIELSKDIQTLALNSTKTIGAFFNDVDVMVGEKGAYIIENNPTPNFAKRKEKSEKQEIVISKLVEEIKGVMNGK